MDTLVIPGSDKIDVRNKDEVMFLSDSPQSTCPEPASMRLTEFFVHLQVTKRIKGSISSKQHGYEELLSPLIAQVCTAAMPSLSNFPPAKLRINKSLKA